MALSGTVNTTSYDGRYLQLTWTATQSIANNTSTISWTLKGAGTGGSSWYRAGPFEIVVNGVKTTLAATNPRLQLYNGTVVKSGSTTITHNSDGTKSFTISVKGAIYSSAMNCSGSGTFTLNTIARASTISSVTSSVSVNGSNKCAVSISRKSSSFTHTVTWKIGSYSYSATNVGTSTSYAIPTSWLNSIPKATSGTATVTVQTYSGSTKIGSAVSQNFTITVPSTVIPTISNVGITEATSGIASKFNAFVQNRSTLRVAITAAGVYGSTITKYETYIQSVLYSGSSFTSNVITTSGTIGVRTTVTDSRGRTTTVTNNVTIVQYSVPTITTFSGIRCDADGTPNDDGTNVKLELNFSISNVNNLNDKSYSIDYKLTSASSWTNLTSGSVYSYNDNYVTDAIFSVDNSYNIKLTITDYFTSQTPVTAEIDITTAFTLYDVRTTGKGWAFGKVSEKDCLEINMDVEITGTSKFIQEDRQTPTLLNHWVNYGSSYESATYWKDQCGVVHLAGLIKSGTTTAETVIFTLPEGYRPRVSEKFFAVSLNAICVIDVYASGNVAIKTGANSGWLSLSGISFRSSVT